jgi:hypothetical protein
MSSTKTSPVFKPEIDFNIDEKIFHEKATIVHCIYTSYGRIRIWPSTFLVQEDGTRKKLLNAFNIAEYPEWRFASRGHRFTLIFEALEKTCKQFELLENIPEPGGFYVSPIHRNQTDVYNLNVE